MTAPPPGIHSRHAADALRALAEADPALSALSLWCAHRDGDATGTDARAITYGPDVADLAPHERMGLCAHHVLHVALRHPGRMGALRDRLGDGFEPDLFNIAADAVVNEVLLQADHALPRPALRLTEVLRDVLSVDVPPPTALSDWGVDRLYHALARDGGAAGRARDHAAARGMRPDLAPDGDDAAGGDDDGDDARWRNHLIRALESGRAAGRGIGRIGHRLADIPEPRTPWEIVLRRLLARAVTVAPRPAPLRPARRWLAATAQARAAGTPAPGFQPGTRPLAHRPRIVVALDASGSVEDARLALFWGEVTGIARRLSAELHLLVFDDAIRHRAAVDPTRTPRPPPLPRDGGTDFAPVIAEALALDAAALVVLTDLDGPFGPPPRSLTVVWAVPDGTSATAPFGRVLNLAA
ncbi:DUF2201 family putative metallopeptidase [Jannaschia sp. LMIT008]|uniref:vWA domain-containing protein n=1 Tax=Jannaschia maritima TaxID=3032585 RepID=UPI0028127A47|nr:VWA-like domain-containing protein [Jannaschia sp. LMIT008]